MRGEMIRISPEFRKELDKMRKKFEKATGNKFSRTKASKILSSKMPAIIIPFKENNKEKIFKKNKKREDYLV